MIKKQQQFIPKGMNQDIAETKIQSDFAHSIKNFRVVTDETSGTLSLVTEKGTEKRNLPIKAFYKISDKIKFNYTGSSSTNFLTYDQSINSFSTAPISFYYNYCLKWFIVTLTFPNDILFNEYKINSKQSYLFIRQK